MFKKSVSIIKHRDTETILGLYSFLGVKEVKEVKEVKDNSIFASL